MALEGFAEAGGHLCDAGEDQVGEPGGKSEIVPKGGRTGDVGPRGEPFLHLVFQAGEVLPAAGLRSAGEKLGCAEEIVEVVLEGGAEADNLGREGIRPVG